MLTISAPLIILLLSVSSLAVLPAATGTVNTPAQPISPAVTPTQLNGYKVTGTLSPSAEVYVTVGIPLRNLQTLQYLEQQISTPGSSMYRSFLTPAQVAQDFLPVAQYQDALSYLQSRGFTIVMSSLDSIIVAQATAGLASSELGLSYQVLSDGNISYYTASGESPLAGSYLYSSNVTAALFHTPPTLVTKSTIAALASRTPAQVNQTAPETAYSLPEIASAYNASSLYASGIDGSGYTAGVLDFYGDPYIQGQMQYFDQIYGLPPVNLHIITVGPYDPSLGVVEGWDVEISLDVESVHSTAPGAAIDMYVANGALPLAAAVAPVVMDDKVNVLSQSVGIPDGLVSELGASGLDLNVILTDQYYLLGSAEGITFTASSGDRGGTGDSGGPEGTPLYPAVSPYVVAVGGTSTFLDYTNGQVSSSYQTAWSNYGFSPDGANYGGATSGVSILEPRPWYQSAISAPPSGYADGRIIPDVSLNASPFPGAIIIVDGNLTEVSGGTSESSPLLAGLLTLLMQSSKGSLGLINPSLYALGQSSALGSRAFTPVSFGYNIPWVGSSSGFNFLAGWGAPNIGEIAQFGLGGASARSLAVNVTVGVGGVAKFTVKPGEALDVKAVVTDGALTVSSGTFTASVETLNGPGSGVALTYNAKTGAWAGEVPVPAGSSGLEYVTVSGSSSGTSGVGFTQVFSGYVATFMSPILNTGTGSPLAYSSTFGIPLEVNITTLDGNPITNSSFSVSLSSYSISTNTYTPVGSVPMNYGFGPYGQEWIGNITGAYPNGAMMISTNGGAYGYLPFINGVGLQASFIEGTVLAEPGVVAPGQVIFILASLQPPLNMPYAISQETGLTVASDVAEGSNVTATLVNSAGVSVASAQIYANSFISGTTEISGEMTVPTGLAPGLYTVMLNSNFDSYTLGISLGGSYFGQIYVASSDSIPQISVTPSVVFEGQTATISAAITYDNGSNVRYGMYQATLYPNGIQNFYSSLTLTMGVPLFYDTTSGLWLGTVTLPSPYNGGGSVSVDPGAVYPNGPYDILVTGLSADGVPTSTDIATQQGFIVQPYVLFSGQTFASSPQTSGVAFNNDTITSSMNLNGDVFTGTNSITGGSVTIVDSQINGTLSVSNAQLTLIGVSGGTVVAQGSKITLEQSSVDSLQLTGSQVSLNASTFGQISPSLPSISVQSPAANQVFNGTSGSVTVAGQGVSSVAVYLDGSPLTVTGSGPSYSFQLASSSLQDGVHLLNVVASQQDGMSSSQSTYFTTGAQLAAAQGQISSASATISSLGSQLSTATTSIGSLSSQLNNANGSIGGLSTKLNSENNTISNLMDELYVLGAVAVIALVVGLASLMRRNRTPSEPAPTPAPMTSPTSPSAPDTPTSPSNPETPGGSPPESPTTPSASPPPAANAQPDQPPETG